MARNDVRISAAPAKISADLVTTNWFSLFLADQNAHGARMWTDKRSGSANVSLGLYLENWLTVHFYAGTMEHGFEDSTSRCIYAETVTNINLEGSR